MERLTENYKIKDLCENDVYCEMTECQIQLLKNAVNKLAEYEKTCLEPSEVEQLKGKREVLWEKIDKLTAEVISAYRERDKFRAELEELKKNAIVPKFNVGDEVYSYFLDYNNKRVIKKTSVLEITINKTIIYSLTNGGYKEEEKLFYTRKEAEEALKKLEEK